MMVVTPIDQQAFDDTATGTTYCKLFPYMIEHFLTREDAKIAIKSNNLIVSVTATGNTNVMGAAGAMSGVTITPVNTQVAVIYDGIYKVPGTTVLAQQIKAKKLAGDVGVGALTKGLEEAMG
jgi:hypothetical protein